jgi:hypothetical protein
MTVIRPVGLGKFEFVVMAALRSAQLMRGCLPKIDTPSKPTVVAQLEVAAGMVPNVGAHPVWPLVLLRGPQPNEH